MEELVIQRQKRIAERTTAAGSTPLVSKKVPTDSKTANASPKQNKHPIQSTTRETRTVSGQIKHKGGSALLKSAQVRVQARG